MSDSLPRTGSASRSGADLRLPIDFADGVAMAVAGELDLASAPYFAAVLDAVIDRGHRRVLVDCSELRFIDASGVGILAAAQARLLRADGEMRVHGASGLVYRIFEITDLIDQLHVEGPDPGSRSVGISEGAEAIAWQAPLLAADSARAEGLTDA